jgi:diguanylate cyclase (GGDEF)-like protein
MVSKKRSTPPKAKGRQGDRQDDDVRRLVTLSDEQQRAAGDQTESDADQTASDSDQTASDLDGDLSARDQSTSAQDQEASDRDQAASDEEFRIHPVEGLREAHQAGSAARAKGVKQRTETAQERSVVADDRVRHGAERDETAWRRDITAQARDAAALRQDQESERLERKMASRGTALRTALAHARQVRAQAARDRLRAADDRAQAAHDRERAAEERSETLAELKRAHLDELTGALRRGVGEAALQNEVDRAQRGDGKLVLAFVDVDSLRDVNNRHGHGAGDALLQDVVSAIRSNIRSYEPIVRYGGDEFVCAMAGVDRQQAESRFKGISDSVASRERGSAITVGLAELQPDDGLPELVDRADKALLAARGHRPRGGD